MTDLSMTLTGAWLATLRGVRPLHAALLFAALLMASVLWDLTVTGLALRALAFGVMVGAFTRSGLRRVVA